jgi:hypothetical protein
VKRSVNVCEDCRHWKASDAGCFGLTALRGVKGYCHRHCLVTYDSGHCAFFSKIIRVVVRMEAAA